MPEDSPLAAERMLSMKSPAGWLCMMGAGAGGGVVASGLGGMGGMPGMAGLAIAMPGILGTAGGVGGTTGAGGGTGVLSGMLEFEAWNMLRCHSSLPGLWCRA
jgi:cation transporter-like permease